MPAVARIEFTWANSHLQRLHRAARLARRPEAIAGCFRTTPMATTTNKITNQSIEYGRMHADSLSKASVTQMAKEGVKNKNSMHNPSIQPRKHIAAFPLNNWKNRNHRTIHSTSMVGTELQYQNRSNQREGHTPTSNPREIETSNYGNLHRWIRYRKEYRSGSAQPGNKRDATSTPQKWDK